MFIQAPQAAPTPSPVNGGQPSLPKPSQSPVAVLIVVGVVVAIITVGIFLRSAGSYLSISSASNKAATPKTKNRPLPEVVRTPLSISIAQMSSQFPEARRESNSLYIDVDDPCCEKIRYDWDPSAPAHVSQVYLAFSQPPSQRKAWVNQLAPILGRRGVRMEQDVYEYNGCGVRMSLDAEKVDVAGQPMFDARWQTQLQSLWELVRAIVITRTEPPNPSAIRDRLGDLPFARLANFDVRVDVDASRRALVAAFPNVCIRDETSVEFNVPVDNRWIGHASFVWNNQRGGKLDRIEFWPPKVHNEMRLADQAAVAECLVPYLGKPAKQESDHAKNEWTYRWNVPGGSCIVYWSYVLLEGRPIRSDWPKLVHTFEGCGR